MKNNTNTYKLLNSGGCLTEEAMYTLLNNTLSVKDKKIADDHLSDCEFCQDALEGLSLLENTETAKHIVSGLNARINNRTKTRSISKQWAYISIAASVAIVIGMFFLYNNMEDQTNKNIADNINKETLSQEKEEEAIQEHVSKQESVEESNKENKEEISLERSLKKEAEKKTIDIPKERASNSETIIEAKPSAPVAIEQSLAIADDVSKPEQLQSIIDEDDEFAFKDAKESYQDIDIPSRDKGDIPSNDVGSGMIANTNTEGSNLDEVSKKSKDNSPILSGGRRSSVSKRFAPASSTITESKNEQKSLSIVEFEDVEAFDEEEVEEEMYVTVEEMPKFQEKGIEAFSEYIAENIKYPKEAQESKIEGSVIVEFVVDKYGKVKDSKVVRSVDPVLDKEALRVINSSPDWTPGKQRGKTVNVKFMFPVKFRLD